MRSYIGKDRHLKEEKLPLKADAVLTRLGLLCAFTFPAAAAGLVFHNHLLCCGAIALCAGGAIFLMESLPQEAERPAGQEETVHVGISAWYGIVFFLIAILAAYLVPNYLRAHESGCFCACKSNLKSISTALEMYSTDNGGRYPSSLKDLMPGYIRVIPTCPKAGYMTYAYVSKASPDTYTAYCRGSHHRAICRPDFPQYDSIQGLYYH